MTTQRQSWSAEPEPCFCCQKPVNLTKGAWRFHYVWTTAEGEQVDQGWYVLGASCRRKYPDAEWWPA